MKQMNFEKIHWKHRLCHGGELRKQRAGRGSRPLSSKDPLHVVLKAQRSCLGKKIQVVTCDQHKGYAESVREFCPQAEWEKYKDEEAEDDLMHGKYRYIYLTKAKNRSLQDRQHIQQVMDRNQKISQMEYIKEHYHKIFDQTDARVAQNILTECYEWATEIRAYKLAKYFWDLFDRKELLNYFKHKLTSGVSEGINQAIKGLKWQAYGYKDMSYFALKIMQKCGYLNSKYALSWIYNQ